MEIQALVDFLHRLQERHVIRAENFWDQVADLKVGEGQLRTYLNHNNSMRSSITWRETGAEVPSIEVRAEDNTWIVLYQAHDREQGQDRTANNAQLDAIIAPFTGGNVGKSASVCVHVSPDRAERLLAALGDYIINKTQARSPAAE